MYAHSQYGSYSYSGKNRMATNGSITPQPEQEFLASYQRRDYDAPLLTVDMVIFSVFAGQLQVLLIQRGNYPQKGSWALPGGFANLQADADLMATAHRKLFEKTAIASPYLEQVGTVGNASRDPRGWAVTVLYFALVDFQAITQPPQPAAQLQQQAEYSQWVPVQQAQQLALAFDHQQLLGMALERLSNKTRYTALPISLMPAQFTLTELQQIYEIILQQSLDKKAFRRRVLEAGVVVETGQSKLAGKRPAQLYRYAHHSFDFHFARMLELPRNPQHAADTQQPGTGPALDSPAVPVSATQQITP